MVNFILVLVSLMIIPCMAAPGWAAPTVKVTTSTPSIEKGGVFQIRLELSTTEDLKNIVIAPLLPNGFTADPLPSPSLQFIPLGVPSEPDKKSAERKEIKGIKIDELTAGSALTASFNVWPPGITGKPKEGEKEGYYDTREPKSFVFNITYNTRKNGAEIKGSVTAATNVRYTTAMGIYLMWGMIGVVMGYFIKVGTKNRDNITSAFASGATFRQKSISVWNYLVVANLPSLLTIMMIGFGALLVMAKEAIPVNSWHQSIALGIGLAVLSDEQLLGKFKA